MKYHNTNLDTTPLIPFPSWKILEHKKLDNLLWIPENIYMHTTESQKYSCVGDTVRTELNDLILLNATILDYILANTDILPKKLTESKIGCCLFFWGTIYLDIINKGLYIRGLINCNGSWTWCWKRTDNYWCNTDFAAIL